jgi:putative flippase GtrA
MVVGSYGEGGLLTLNMQGVKDVFARHSGVFIRYSISGGVAAVAHFGLLIILVEWTNTNPTLASAIGFCIAIFVNYTLLYHYTFKAVGSHSVMFTRYVIVTVAMLGVNTTIFWILNEQQDVPYLMAQVVATGIVVMLNFNINRLYTFKSSACGVE